jgi:hypothetical protein
MDAVLAAQNDPAAKRHPNAGLRLTRTALQTTTRLHRDAVCSRQNRRGLEASGLAEPASVLCGSRLSLASRKGIRGFL